MTIKYVALNGNDNNPGTLAQPYASIAKGIQNLLSGDTLYLRQGIYDQVINIAIPNGASWAVPTIIASYPGEVATLLNSTTPAITITDGANSSYIIFDRLTLQGPGSPSTPLSTVHGIYLGIGSNHISFTRGDINNQLGSGVRDTGISNEITNTVIRNNYNHGYHGTGSFCIIDNNSIFNNGGQGIFIWQSGSISLSNNIIRNNKVYNNGGIYKVNNGLPNYFSTFGITISSGPNNLCYNNLVYDNLNINGGGILIGLVTSPGNTNNRCYNNTIYNNDGIGLFVDSTTVNSFASNNISYLNHGSNNILDLGNGNTLVTNFTNDPIFVDTTSRDLRLQGVSPCVNTGTTITDVELDILGTDRPQGTNYDIGAYEYAVIFPAPYVWYPIEEASGTITPDKSGSGYTATFINSPVRVAGISGPYAIQFNGTTNYITNTSFTWPANSPVTVLFWAYVFAPGYTSAFGVGPQVGPNRFHVHLPYDNTFLYWDYGDVSNAAAARLTFNYASYIGAWHHIALVSAGFAGAFKAVYIDTGIVVSNNSSDGPRIQLTGLEVGRASDFGSATSLWFNGIIDDFQIYNAVLNQQDILMRTHQTPTTRHPFRPITFLPTF